MIRLTLLLVLSSLSFLTCKQNKYSATKKSVDKRDQSRIVRAGQLTFDTTEIAFLPIDTSNRWIFKEAMPLNLTNQDLNTVEELLSECIKGHNAPQDTTQEFSEYIDLKKYKRQYVPFVDSKGEKKVYVNCFCVDDADDEFSYWKNNLVEVEDGGSCFFHVTINLSKSRYEQFQTNGYA